MLLDLPFLRMPWGCAFTTSGAGIAAEASVFILKYLQSSDHKPGDRIEVSDRESRLAYRVEKKVQGSDKDFALALPRHFTVDFPCA
jgi:hypothetical protein